jgi:hypothetical protein
MTTAIRAWYENRRYRALLHDLRAIPTTELRALWITPDDIPRVARQASERKGASSGSSPAGTGLSHPPELKEMTGSGSRLQPGMERPSARHAEITMR